MNILQRSWLGCPAKKLAGMSMPAFTLFTPSSSVAGHMKILHSGSNCTKSGLSITSSNNTDEVHRHVFRGEKENTSQWD